jgi:hypothetical protein
VKGLVHSPEGGPIPTELEPGSVQDLEQIVGWGDALCMECGDALDGFNVSVAAFERTGMLVCDECGSDDDGQPDEEQEWSDYDATADQDEPVSNAQLIAQLQAVTLGIHLVGLDRLPEVMGHAVGGSDDH